MIAGFFVNSTDANVQNIANGIVRLFTGSRLGLGLSWELVIYTVLYFALVVGFTYFYTNVVMEQQNLAENLQKQGGFIPGIRPGKTTDQFIMRIMRRLTLVGALFLGMLAVTPYLIEFVAYGVNLEFLQPLGGNSQLISGAGLLIVVGVVLDTMRQLEAQLMMRRYEGFIR